MNEHDTDCTCARCCREAKAELSTLRAEHNTLLDALEIRVAPGRLPGRISGGQTTSWIWNDEHEHAVDLLRALGREPIAGANPHERCRLNPADTRLLVEGVL